MVPGNLIQPVTVIFAIPGTVVTGAQENLVGLVTGLLKQLEVSLCFKCILFCVNSNPIIFGTIKSMVQFVNF